MKRALLFLFCVVCCYAVFAQTQYTQLPTFYIKTDNPNAGIGKSEYVESRISIVSNDPTECMTDVVLGIRGRGNSTWGMAKKPYRIKFDKKTKLLNLKAKAKSWVLLANYADKTLMRNAVALEVSSYIGMEFTPSVRFVDVVLNGEFLGNYMVSDQVEVGKGRVPVEEQETTDTEEPAITGGYLVELDGFASSEPVWFQTPQGLKVTVKYPKDDEINLKQRKYITDYICNFEKVLFSEQFTDPTAGYRPWVDEKALINWYIACELVGNSDSFWSTYIYKKREDPHLYFGPLWDYDIAFNNDNRLGDATYKLMREAAHNPKNWIQRMWKDPWFRHAVNVRWRELLASGIEEHLLTYVSETASLLDRSQTLNYDRWKVLNKRVYLETQLFDTYSAGVDYLKAYVKNRISFLTESFDDEDSEEEELQPFEVSNYYYHIMNRHTSNVVDIAGESKDERAELVSWSLSNERVTQEWIIHQLKSGHFILINRHSGLAACGNGRNNSLIQVEPDFSDPSQLWDITPVHPDVYALTNVKSGSAIENYNGSSADGNKLIEATAAAQNSRNQQWYLEKTEETIELDINPELPPFVADAGYYYSLISQSAPDRLASIDRSGGHVGAPVILEDPIDDYYAQQWSIKPAADGNFFIYNHFARCMMQASGTGIPVTVERTDESVLAQLWAVLPVDDPADGEVYVLKNIATGGYAGIEDGRMVEQDAFSLQVKNLRWVLKKSVPILTGLSSYTAEQEVQCLSAGKGQIRFILPEGETDVRVNISSLSGVLLCSEMLSIASGGTMDVSTLSTGVYLAEVVMSGHIYHLKFFLLQ
ncbi:CotH kinase family protein [Bacteroides sp.]